MMIKITHNIALVYLMFMLPCLSQSSELPLQNEDCENSIAGSVSTLESSQQYSQDLSQSSQQNSECTQDSQDNHKRKETANKNTDTSTDTDCEMETCCTCCAIIAIGGIVAGFIRALIYLCHMGN